MKNKKLKIIIGAIIAVVAILATVLVVSKISSEKPVDAVENFITGLTQGDFAKAKTYTSDETFSALEINETEENLDMIKLYFSKVSYKINNVTKSKNTTIISMDITNKNLSQILQNYMKKAYELAINTLNKKNTPNIEQQLLDYFKQQFESEEIENMTTTVDVVMNKVNGQWKVVVDEALRDALLPGLNNVNIYGVK